MGAVLEGALWGAAIGAFSALAAFAFAMAVFNLMRLLFWLSGVLGEWFFPAAAFVSWVALCAAVGAGGGLSQ